MKNYKKLLSLVLTAAIVLTAGAFTSLSAEAASKKLKVSAKKITVNVKSSKKVTVKNKPKGAKVTWSVANKKIATVKKGKITGKKAGSTKVTCKVTYKKNSKKKTSKFTIKVTVKKKVATSATKAPAATTVPTVAPTAAPPVVTPVPTTTPAHKGSLITWDDTSNIGEAKEVTIAGGATVDGTSINAKMIVKDNGTMRKDTTSQYLIKNEMGLGVNLGNTMEATKGQDEMESCTEATDFEQAWGAPLTTQEYIDSMHSYGVNTLRIPVAWSSMMSTDGKYTINEKFLGRVEQIINYALNNGMYVVINDHWDYGWWGMFGSADKTMAANAWVKYEAMWTQITERFKNYSDHLIFESANEELCTRLNDKINDKGMTDDNGAEGILTVDECYTMAQQINQKFVDIVRASGGNNTYRHLLIAGFGTDIDKTLDERFAMPTDIAENGKTKLSVSVHYYSPTQICLDGADGSVTYTKADGKYTHKKMATMSKFVDEGYGVMIGEYGVVNPKQNKVPTILTDVIESCVETGCAPIQWEIPGSYFNRTKNVMVYKDIAELYNTLTGATGTTEGIYKNTGLPTETITSVELTGNETPVWSWTGTWQKNDGSSTALDGSHVTAGDVTKFVKTDSCTDDSKISFNEWGYQAFLKMDWSELKNPCIKMTFADDTEDVVGKLDVGTVANITDPCSDNVKYDYSTWAGKGIVFPDTVLTSLKGDNPYMYLTFEKGPVITKIEVFDLGA